MDYLSQADALEAILWDGFSGMTTTTSPATSSMSSFTSPATASGINPLPADSFVHGGVSTATTSTASPYLGYLEATTNSFPTFHTLSPSASSSPSSATPSLYTNSNSNNNVTPPALLDLAASDTAADSNKRKRDRERNTEAARRYRKRRVDETDDLRAQLVAMTKDRDELKLKLVRAEAEASLLRKLHVASAK